MRTNKIIIMAWLCFGTIQAQQKIEKHIDFSGKETLTLNIQIADSITVHSWNKNEVFITASVNINDNKDNEAYSTSFNESGNPVVVTANFSDNYFKGKNNCCVESEIYWYVYLPEKAGLTIETINANITLGAVAGPVKIKSISGYIDMGVHLNRKADIEFSTISGRIYSNHKFVMNKKAGGVPTVIKERLNEGGPSVRLETISGDIFFRILN